MRETMGEKWKILCYFPLPCLCLIVSDRVAHCARHDEGMSLQISVQCLGPRDQHHKPLIRHDRELRFISQSLLLPKHPQTQSF